MTSNLTEQVFLITLPSRPQASSDIERATRKITAATPRHVVFDNQQVQIISSSTISELLIIENHLHELNRQLVLCRVPEKIQALLISVGLQSLFQIANDSLEAFEMLEVSS